MRKVLFLGANLAGIKCIQLMIEHPGIEIVGVLPRINDNGSISDESAWNASVRRFGNKNGLDVFRESDANNSLFYNWAKSLKPDYIISVQYDIILKSMIRSLPVKGCLNLHFSLLPYGKGCMPIPWAMFENKAIGATLHYIDRGIDTGPIISQIKCDYSYSDTAYSVYMRLTEKSVQLFKSNLNNIANGNVKSEPQPTKKQPRDAFNNTINEEINWKWSGDKIDRFVRARTFNGFKSAETSNKNELFEINHPVTVKNNKTKNKDVVPGQILYVNKDSFIICTKDGSVTVNDCSLIKPYTKHFKVGDIIGDRCQ